MAFVRQEVLGTMRRPVVRPRNQSLVKEIDTAGWHWPVPARKPKPPRRGPLAWPHTIILGLLLTEKPTQTMPGLYQRPYSQDSLAPVIPVPANSE